MPDVSVRVEDLYGAETVFLSIGTRYMTGSSEHTVMIAISGDRSSILQVLEECRQAVEGDPR